MDFEEGDTIKLGNGQKFIILNKKIPFLNEYILLREDGEIIFLKISKFSEKKICKNILIEKDYNKKFINKSILSIRKKSIH